jgi:hypothetical protein
MNVMIAGGTINADFQCGEARSVGRVGKDPIRVFNSCKDFRPSEYWVCVCLRGLRYFHVDVRHFDSPTNLRTPKDLREHMAFRLGHSGFADANALWKYAREHDWPRTLSEVSCISCGIVIDPQDLALAARRAT